MDLARALRGREVYDCAACARQPHLLRAFGHDGPPQQFWKTNLVTGAPLRECPMRTLLRAQEEDPETWREVERYRLTYYPLYRDHGHLQVEGGIDDQPALFLAYMRLFQFFEQRVQARYTEIRSESADDDDPDD